MSRVKTPPATRTVRGGIALFYFPGGGADGYAVFLYGQELKNVTTGESIFRPGFAFKFPADGGRRNWSRSPTRSLRTS